MRSYFKPPETARVVDEAVQADPITDEAVIQPELPQAPKESFAYEGQLRELQNKLDDAIYKLNKKVLNSKALVEEATENMNNKIVEFHEKLRIKKSDSPLEVNEEWHAEFTDEMLHSAAQLKTFVQDEVYLQFAHHFAKLTKLKDQKQSSEKSITLQNRKVSHMSMKLLELESKQLMELTKVRN